MSPLLDPSVEQPLAAQDAADLLATGIPLDLTAQAAQDYITHCQTTRALLGTADSLLNVKIMTAQIAAIAQIEPTTGTQIAADVARMAHRLGSEVAGAYADLAWALTHPGPEFTGKRIPAAYRILDVASRSSEHLLLEPGYVVLLTALLEAGEIRSLDIELLYTRFAATAPQQGIDPAPIAWFNCLRSLLDGDGAGAEQQAKAIYEASKKGENNALGLYTTQLCMIRWMQGDLQDIEDLFLTARRVYPHQLLWSASLAWLWLLQGRRSAAESLLRKFPDVSELPRNRYWLSTVVVLAEIVRLVGGAEHGHRLREILLPYANRLVPVGVGVAFWGTAARTLGLLEESLGLIDDALVHLQLALEQSEKIGALAWQAEAQIELAEFSLRHEIPGIPAYELLEEARLTATARGFKALEHRAMYRPRIKVFGGFEVISVCGKRAEWTSRKARELLKMLIAARGVATSREVYMDALWPDEPPEVLGNRFSVAVNVIRRALDPQRLNPTQHYLQIEGDSVRLNIANLDIDMERFFALAAAPDAQRQAAALELYTGDLFSEDPYSDWATVIRERARAVHAKLEAARGAMG